MKKFLCLLVALLLVGSISFAESIDLSSMTDTELFALKEQVEQILMDHDSSFGMRFASGIYVAGTDIKPGRYIIHTSNDQGLGNLYVYANKEAMDTDETIFYQFVSSSTEQDFSVSLEESNVLVLKMEGYAYISKVGMIG